MYVFHVESTADRSACEDDVTDGGVDGGAGVLVDALVTGAGTDGDGAGCVAGGGGDGGSVVGGAAQPAAMKEAVTNGRRKYFFI